MTDKFTLPIDSDGVLSVDELLAALTGNGEPVESDSRDETAPTVGRVIRDTTDGQIYVGDGSQWRDKSWLSTGGAMGASGGFVKLTAFNLSVSSNFTSTTYTNITSTRDIVTVDFGDVPSSVANLHISLNFAQLSNDTAGETTFVRLRLRNSNTTLPDTEVTAQDSAFDVVGNRQGARAVVPVSGAEGLQLQGRVTAGTGTIQGPAFIIWAELK